MGLPSAWRVIPAPAAVLLVAVLLVAACQSRGATVTTDGEAAGPNVVVEVDIFSGVPNPKWPLDADSAARLATLVLHLTPAPDEQAPSEPGLGFRGFVVHGLDLGSVSGSPGADATLHVRGDDVVATAGDRQALFADPRHQMYTTLRNLALRHLPSDIAAHIPASGLMP